MVQQRLMAVVLGGKVPAVSDSEVRRIYETEFPKEKAGVRLHLKMLNLPYPPQATASQKDEITKKAEVILKEHKQGASLEDISQRYSLALRDLGFIAEADLDPKLAAFLSKLKPGEVAPIQSPQGFQLVGLAARKTASETRSFDEVGPQIRQMLMQRELGKRFGEWVKTLRDKAHIKILL
jgi:peptidyl-prolyl cis-trans isomerase SurA